MLTARTTPTEMLDEPEPEMALAVLAVIVDVLVASTSTSPAVAAMPLSTICASASPRISLIAIDAPMASPVEVLESSDLA